MASLSFTPSGSQHSIPRFEGFHEWHIEKFSTRTHAPGFYLTTLFKVPVRDEFGRDVDTVWKITLYPNGCTPQDANYLSLFLCQESGPCHFVRFSFSINTIRSSFKKLLPSNTRICFGLVGNERFPGRGWKRYISVPTVKNYLLQSSDLNIVCSLQLEISTDSVPRFQPNQEIFKYGVHKFMLAQYSDVFKAMFSHDFAESRSNRVTILDIKSEAIEEMIRFIYSGSTRDIRVVHRALYKAADKYNIIRLKLACETSIINSLKVDNACSTLIFARDNFTNYILNATTKFISYNLNRVKYTQGWQEVIQHADLVDQIFKGLDL
ncbi:SPOP [Lepeophtheirus salmonis]|uniref:SPOP n=1 Tax=Lepeophtheirus salmonis TaxID=72036 RepID=A0A7R8D023_LEPSM|nr:SPOP [Lepeophtheirus salmonis]CAF2980120.1 SPOP [Lepeophtheirus salmonis]